MKLEGGALGRPEKALGNGVCKSAHRQFGLHLKQLVLISFLNWFNKAVSGPFHMKVHTPTTLSSWRAHKIMSVRLYREEETARHVCTSRVNLNIGSRWHLQCECRAQPNWFSCCCGANKDRHCRFCHRIMSGNIDISLRFLFETGTTCAGATNAKIAQTEENFAHDLSPSNWECFFFIRLRRILCSVSIHVLWTEVLLSSIFVHCES